MIRLFISEVLEINTIISLNKKHEHYLMHVMRLKKGDSILAFNGRDGEWVCQVETNGKKSVFLCVQQQIRSQTFLKECILCPALIKKENMDFVLQKATELGVTALFPVITQRTVVRQFNRERAIAIVTEAAEQSERLTRPLVYEPVPLLDLPRFLPEQAQIVFLSERQEATSDAIISDLPAFLIGPEGGFTPMETDWLTKQSFVVPLHLGKTILRAETAALAVLSSWQFRVFK